MTSLPQNPLYNPSLRHPVFFTERLRKPLVLPSLQSHAGVNQQQQQQPGEGSGRSIVAEGYRYIEHRRPVEVGKL
ncbi:hypothetical protein TWF106_000056 [Orbilia oligospora]|uniref:Uncharacterized protein n=1 Tax=Orbilia oligospora TaxID=2813651 RepID=A0A7C8V424_ORBOL|nr:hypothetical protein TWF106_000056 [Orbilia oligospora]